MIRNGISHSKKREVEKQEAIAETLTFEKVARDWHSSNKQWSIGTRFQTTTKDYCYYAVQNGLIARNPAQDLKGALATRESTHRPALPLERLPDFLTRLEHYKGRHLTILAVRLTLYIYLFVPVNSALHAGEKLIWIKHCGQFQQKESLLMVLNILIEVRRCERYILYLYLTKLLNY